jgi:hypothetical protein
MIHHQPIRRNVLQRLAALLLAALAAQAKTATAQPPSPVKVDTKGLVAKIKIEAVLAGTSLTLTASTNCG